jgi:DNA polymerase-1
MIEFDVETTSLAHHGENPCRTFLVQFGAPDEDDPYLVPRDMRDADVTIQRLLSKDDGYRAWNTKFDLHCLKQAGFRLPPEDRWHDGMVAAHIIDERSSVALQARADRLFGPDEAGADLERDVKKWLQEEDGRRRKASKETGEEFIPANYGDVPSELMTPYAANDIRNTRMVSGVYFPQIEGNPAFKRLYDLEMRVMRALFAAEDRGIPVDREAMVNCEAALLPEIERLEDRAIEISKFDGFNPRSPKQIGEALERLGANVGVMDRSGATKQLVTDEENLHAVNHPLGDAILAYRGETGIYKWLRGALHGPTGEDAKRFPGAYLTSDDRLHPNFRQLGARTGRMSCSNPNFQNIPRDDLRLRYAIKADPGKKLVVCDLDSIELVLLAAFAGNGTIHEAVTTGKDLHAITAQRVGLTGRRRSTGATESPRDQGKRLNYLIVYGGGIKAIMKWFGVARDRARQIMDAMHKAYPEVTALQSQIDWKLEDRGYLESPLTQRRYRMYGSGYVAVQKEGYKFINYLIQGTAADVLKIAIANLHERGIPIVAAVHDELIAHVDAADSQEAAHEIEQAMTHGFEMAADGRRLEEVVPITAEAKIVDRWSQAKKPDYIPEYAT